MDSIIAVHPKQLSSAVVLLHDIFHVLDRFIAHAEIVQMFGKSYRLRTRMISEPDN